ncbi:MAG TPA: 23S rRNA (uracil(1939)-C(5))-methyltransferase RlmD [Spirochaetia bacterium]|nr:23S rRNA (uracil(1939)-C(5))-methyltransferase RlmD [Spirochaetia bacterium]
MTIDGITHAGEGVGRYGGLAVFVPGAAPGETVLAEMDQVRKNYARARLVEVQVPSPARREPACRHFPACGGCHLQHLAYPEQLRLKTGLVRDSLTRLAGLGDVPVRNTLGMAGDSLHYRNKVHFQIGHRFGKITLGYYGEKSHALTGLFPDGAASAALLHPGCLLADPGLNIAAAAVQELLNVCAAGAVPGKGNRFFRHVLLRKGLGTGEMMVVVVTTAGPWPLEHEFAAKLVQRHPDVRSIVRNLHDGPDETILGRENRVLAGQPTITDRLEHWKLRLSPSSFYQVNPAQTLLLYRNAAAFAGLRGGETVVDAYSGVGSLTLWLAAQARRVYGLEIEPAAVADARANAVLNQVANVDFQRGDVAELLPTLAATGVVPDVVMLDPPRRGCSRTVLKTVAALEVPKVVYLSCDPGTLARDLAFLVSRGYRVDEVQPVDMFPWTPHIECVVKIEKK